MNTPAHAIINLALLSGRPDHARSAAIVSGAIIPDLAMIGFYAWHKLLGTDEALIWSLEYYRPLWQSLFDGFHSIALIALALLASWMTRHPLWLIFFASMLLHACTDLPLHHDDAHRHFFPFSDWRFASPVSYWDPAHYGRWASLLEISAVLGAAAWLYRRYVALRLWVVPGVLIYLVYWIYVLLVWA